MRKPCSSRFDAGSRGGSRGTGHPEVFTNRKDLQHPSLIGMCGVAMQSHGDGEVSWPAQMAPMPFTHVEYPAGC